MNILVLLYLFSNFLVLKYLMIHTPLDNTHGNKLWHFCVKTSFCSFEIETQISVKFLESNFFTFFTLRVYNRKANIIHVWYSQADWNSFTQNQEENMKFEREKKLNKFSTTILYVHSFIQFVFSLEFRVLHFIGFKGLNVLKVEKMSKKHLFTAVDP